MRIVFQLTPLCCSSFVRLLPQGKRSRIILHEKKGRDESI